MSREVDLRGFVTSLAPDELSGLLMEQAAQDGRLRDRLVAQAAAAQGIRIDAAMWKSRIDSAFGSGRVFIPYREAVGWAGEVNAVIDAVEDLVDAGHAETAVSLVEHAHRRADTAMQHIDDSDGHLSVISSRLGSIHLRACEEISPDPVELARRLVDLELTSELGAFHRAASTYARVLGPTGIDEYRRLVEPKFCKLIPESDEFSSKGFRIRQARIGIALAAEDPDELIRVRQNALRCPDDYLEVAESLRSAGRIPEAIEWGRLGLSVYVERPWQTGALRELVAGMLHDEGDTEGAIDLFWLALADHPSLASYGRLVAEADLTGQRRRYQERALNALRDRVAAGRAEDRIPRSVIETSPASALIEILLSEGESEQAWAVALEHGCDGRLWLTLARAREADHPLDSISVYEHEVQSQIETKTNRGYRVAADWLARIRRLAFEAGEPRRFDELLSRVRQQHKSKRNLMALLDNSGW
jgi:tetratricopeptide (TPR) repeat protein